MTGRPTTVGLTQTGVDSMTSVDSRPAGGELAVRGVTKTFTDDGRVLRGVDLTVPAGTSLALLGPSGCGKTTLLRVIAGLVVPDEGSVVLDGRVLTDAQTMVPPEKRRVGMVFQNWALFSHLDVARNVGFGLPRAERRTSDRIDEVLAMVDMTEFADRPTDTLSGGQQQRVALARALAPRPEVLLLDEPFSNLDATMRTALRREVRDLLAEVGVTSIFVTHDQEEAFILGDRLAIMDRGSIVQVGEPVEIYERPADRWVASFVGEANFIAGTLTADDRADTMLGSVQVVLAGDADAGTTEGAPVDVLVRPEDILLESVDPGSATTADVVSIEYLGQSTRIGLDGPAGSMVVRETSRPRFTTGERVSVRLVDCPYRVFSA